MKTLLLTFLLGFSCCIAFSQTTTDTTRHHQLDISAKGAINKTTQSSSYLLDNSLGFDIKQNSYKFNIASEWVYGRQNHSLTNNDFSSIVYFDLYKYSPLKHLYYWALANYNTSYSLKINNQLLSGAGIAYSILSDTAARLNISDGLLYDASDLMAYGRYHTVRNSLRLMFHFVVKGVFSFDGSNYWQPSLSNSHDNIIRSKTTLGFKLKKWISLITSLEYNKVDITHSDNLLFTYGVTINEAF